MYCKKCGKKLVEGSFVCIFCGANMEETEEPEYTVITPEVDENLSFQAQSAFKKKLKEYNESGQTADELTEAKLFAQAVELLVLKSPASAIFSPVEDMSAVCQDEVYQDEIYLVQGWVDSQNSYGAMIRTPFNISVTKINGEWKSVSKFINMSAVIGAKMAGNLILYFIIGAILTAISYFIIKASMGF